MEFKPSFPFGLSAENIAAELRALAEAFEKGDAIIQAASDETVRTTDNFTLRRRAYTFAERTKSAG